MMDEVVLPQRPRRRSQRAKPSLLNRKTGSEDHWERVWERLRAAGRVDVPAAAPTSVSTLFKAEESYAAGLAYRRASHRMEEGYSD